jgi:DNA-binding response OmpR family regulator
MGIRVLVVEDEPIIGLDIRQQLANAGFEVLGPATSVATALPFITESGCDVAVLNVNLGNETSEPIARKLQASGKPFVVLSGYSTDDLPPLFNAATILTKPLPMADLLAAVRECIDVIGKTGGSV